MVQMFRRRSFVALVALVSVAVGVGACGGGSGGAATSDTIAGAAPPSTLGGVGALPDTVPANRQPLVMVQAPVNADGSTADLLGQTVAGNRVLVIGDSIMASTSSRYGGQMCDTLVPLGWQVEVEAEPSRFIDFGNRVLDKVLPTLPGSPVDFDAAVVFLGSNYGGDQAKYETELRKILDRLAPRPTLLFTVTEYRSNYSQVNEVVRRLAEEYSNVTLLDWKTIAETPGVLSGDRLHPTERGREVLAQAVAAALGPISIGNGDCLKSKFHDDSAVNGSSGGGSSVGSTRSSGSKTTPTTTVRRATTTTTAPSSGSGSGGNVATTVPKPGGESATTTLPSPITLPTTAPTTAVPTTTPPPAPAGTTTTPP